MKLEERKVLVKEAIENAEADFQEAKLKYKNLEMENIRPYCTNVTTVSDVEYYFLKNYKGITDSLEMYHELLNVLHQLVGENLNEEYFINIFCDEIRPECKYNNFAEYKKALFSGEEKEVCDLSYMSDEEDEDYIFVELQKELAFIYFEERYDLCEKK